MKSKGESSRIRGKLAVVTITNVLILINAEMFTMLFRLIFVEIYMSVIVIEKKILYSFEDIDDVGIWQMFWNWISSNWQNCLNKNSVNRLTKNSRLNRMNSASTNSKTSTSHQLYFYFHSEQKITCSLVSRRPINDRRIKRWNRLQLSACSIVTSFIRYSHCDNGNGNQIEWIYYSDI